ncbi:unnamed protein product [Fraxinus pennsylvanica]|uniref:J domain-containing protein n=1 Tax=Fraxinus pennsylvanica TaxID=56036 RepID=A0AAD1ZF42_9LAMI|nr:unnamed protein product [Fraxinus pennsylvanica]
MDPNFGFNSPALGTAMPAGLSRPQRSIKHRKPLAGPRPWFTPALEIDKLSRSFSEQSFGSFQEDQGIETAINDPGFNTVRPDSGLGVGSSQRNAGRDILFGSNNSSNTGFNTFSSNDMSIDVEENRIAVELRRLRIQSEKTVLDSENANISSSGNRSNSDVFSNVNLCGKDQSVHFSSTYNYSDKKNDCERPDPELLDEMGKLYIGSEKISTLYGGNASAELPNKMKNLNIKSCVSGRADPMLPNKMKNMTIKETLSSSNDGKVDDVSSSDESKFMFGGSGNGNEMENLKIGSGVGNKPDQTKTSSHSFTTSDTQRNSGVANVNCGLGSFNSGLSFQSGIRGADSDSQVHLNNQGTTRLSSLFSSENILDRAKHTVEFSFSSKLDSVATKNMEFKTPEMKGNLFFGLNGKLDPKKESAKDIGSKKRRGKWRKPVQFRFGQDFVFRENLQENAESSEPYSPMDISPYEETLADNNISREKAVASDESFHLDENLSNNTDDEDLVAATERLDINDKDRKDGELQEEEPLNCLNEVVDSEGPEEEVSGAEIESFKSATDELNCSTDTFVTSADTEVSSSSIFEREDNDGGSQFNFASNMAHSGQSNFVFAASSADHCELSASTRFQKKKSRVKVGQDSCSSTPAAKVLHASSHVPLFPVSGSLLSSPRKHHRGDISTLLSQRRDKFEPVKELEAKQENISPTAVSIATQETCEKWRLRGNQAYAGGDFSKAEECYTQGMNCISQNETSRSCLRALMLCYSNRAATRISLGRMREALKDCMEAAALDPNFIRVQVRAANCYLALGEVENATLHFMKCLQAGPEVCVDRKLIIEASEGLQKAQKVTECMEQSSELLQRKTSSGAECALSLITEALMTSVYSEKLREMKVDALLMLKKYEEVIQLCEQTLSSADSNFPIPGDDNPSEKPHVSCLQRSPSFYVWCWSLILKSYFYLGRVEEALGFLKKQEKSVSLMERRENKTLASIIPLASIIHELLHHKAAGNEAYQSGKNAEAVEHYTAAITCTVESRPFAAICFCNRAAAYQAMGQIIDALADCSLAIALDGNYLKAISRRAMLFEMIRDYGQAAADLQKLVSLLLNQVESKAEQSAQSDKMSCMTELRQARLKLSAMEDASRNEFPLNMYLILGIDLSATASEIKKAYRKAALKYHPDKAGQSLPRSENGDDGLWKEIAEEVHKDLDRLFKMIGEAYAVLSDPTKRSRYEQEEEMRNSQNRGKGNMSKMHSDFQNYSFERSGSWRQ